MPLEKDDFVNIKGKAFPSYPGVLRVAIEEKGLVSLSEAITDLRWMDNTVGPVSAPAGWYALATATAVFKDTDGTLRTFTAIGDCGPHNCDKMIAIHAPRMAGTRAKGRALRDALGLEECLSEELGGPDRETPHADPRPPPPTRDALANPARSAPTPRPPVGGEDPFEAIPAMHTAAPNGHDQCAECGKALTKNDLTASAANAKHLDGKSLCMTHIAERRSKALIV